MQEVLELVAFGLVIAVQPIGVIVGRAWLPGGPAAVPDTGTRDEGPLVARRYAVREAI